DVEGRDAIVIAQPREPDTKSPGLLQLAGALRRRGASSVGLVSPYLGTNVIGPAFDWLVTVGPQLQHHASPDEIHGVVVPSAPAIAVWVQTRVAHPFIIGIGAESRQWMATIAALARCRYQVFERHLRGNGA